MTMQHPLPDRAARRRKALKWGFIAALAVLFASQLSGGQGLPVVFIVLMFGAGFCASWFGDRRLEALADALEADDRRER